MTSVPESLSFYVSSCVYRLFNKTVSSVEAVKWRIRYENFYKREFGAILVEGIDICCHSLGCCITTNIFSHEIRFCF
jgi:hypothetical protein